MAVLLNDGNGVFGFAKFYSSGVSPVGIKAADFDGDSKVDLVVASFGSNGASVLLGNGDGTFGKFSLFAAESNTVFVDVADVNSDTNIDIVVSNFNGNSMSVFLGRGTGTFQPAVHYTTGLNPYGVSIGDVNGDDLLDVVTANVNSNSLSLFFGNGDGTFQSQVNRDTGATPTITDIADINNLGIQDIIVAEFGPSSVGVYLNDGGVVSSVPLGKDVFLEITISNSNASPLSAVTFIDTLPTSIGALTGVSVRTIGSGCVDALALPETISLRSGTVPARGSCVYRAVVNGAKAGTTNNAVTVGSSAGTTTSNSAPLEVVKAPTVQKYYRSLADPTPITSMLLNDVAYLIISVQNTATTVSLDGVNFVDSLPNGFVPSFPSWSGTGCTKTLSVTSNSVILSDVTVPASGTCFCTAVITATVSGSTRNTVSVRSDNAATATSPTANLFVIPPPVVQKVYRASDGGEMDANSIVTNAVGDVFLEITIQNTNTFAMTGVQFNDVVPAQMNVVSVSKEGSKCTDATFTSSMISLNNGNVPPQRTCVYVAQLLVVSSGSTTNSVTISTDNAGSATTSSASLSVVVVTPVVATKSYSAVTQSIQPLSTYSAIGKICVSLFFFSSLLSSKSESS